jgi:transposase
MSKITLAAFLRKSSNNACSTRKAEEILALVQTDGDTTRNYQEQRNFLIQSHVRDIQFKKKEIAYVEEELGRMMKLLDFQLETMPGIDLVMASSLVAEIGDINCFASADKLARFAGIAPVNFSSGGKGTNQVCVMRRLVNIIYGKMKNKTAFRLPEQAEKQAR